MPVGYKVLVPKEKAVEIESENGVIKLFKNQNDTFTLRVPDENNNKTNITYNDNTDLLIYGDNTNPNKISFILNGRFEVWEKVEIKTDNLDVEKIAKYIDFSKEELKELKNLSDNNILKNNI